MRKGKEGQYLGYRPAVIGSEKAEIEGLHRFSILDTDILTDSKELVRILEILISSVELKSSHSSEEQSTLVYLTKYKLPFKKRTGELVQPMGLNYPGDIYVSPDLRKFYFQGTDKIGLLLSFIYGIRTSNRVQDGFLGLHSAAIYDSLVNRIHLLIGSNKIGKSSISQIIEMKNPRFTMIADDWSEVDTNSKDYYVEAVSPVFSPDKVDQRYKCLFTSDGKSFYKKDSSFVPEKTPLGKIIELHPFSVTEQKVFLANTLGHVPLFKQPSSEVVFVGGSQEDILNTIRSRKSLIYACYSRICADSELHQLVNDQRTVSLEEISRVVYSILESYP